MTLVTTTSCDKGFDELNTSKVYSQSLDPILVLNNASLNSSPAGANNPGTTTSGLTYGLAISQQMIASNTGVLLGGNFNQVNINNTPLTWQNFYQNVIRYTNNVITRTKDDASRSNLYNMARIVQANAFMVLTDTYGNIPYAEAGEGQTADILFPKYETQQEIYPKIIQEFTEATAALSTAGTIERQDILYNGNIAQWKKFGYSLLLRAGMRLSKVDPAKAKATVAAAFDGGVITSNADNAIVRHDNSTLNGFGNVVNGTEAANFYLAEPFVNALKSTNDPRLSAIAVRYKGAGSSGDQKDNVRDTTAANQYGMPIGSTDGTADAAAKKLGFPNRYSFSQTDRARILKRASPMFIVSAAESNLLLAEAAIRGWVLGGNSKAAEYFSNGIKASMDQMETIDQGSKITVSKRDKYVAANPLDTSTPDAALAQINYQYWIAAFPDGTETWSNWRRSGYPVLTPNPFPGKTVAFIRRITYPPSEILVNSANVQEAISAMGGDNLDTRVWWDK